MSGLMCDILWSDPLEDFGLGDGLESFVYNHVRGCSYFSATRQLAGSLNTTSCCPSFVRTSHKMLGMPMPLPFCIQIVANDTCRYRMYRKTRTTGFPSVMTLFFAPNYLDKANKAAILKYESNILNIRQFHPAPRRLAPYCQICEQPPFLLAMV